MTHSTIRAATVRLFVCATLALLVCAAKAAAQTGTNGTRPRTSEVAAQQQGATANATTADEDFDLNIGERRINRSDFHAETAVEAGGAGTLDLRVGVSVGAAEIDVLLRNVQGHVRFRATLDPLLRLLDAHRTPPQTRPPPDNSP